MGKGSRASTLLPAAQAGSLPAPCPDSRSCRSAGKIKFIRRHLSLAGGVHPAAALLPSPRAAVTKAMEEGWGEGQRNKPGKEK